MQIKQIIKIELILLLIVAILCGGGYAYLKLKEIEKIQNPDLFTFIPANSYAVFITQKPLTCDNQFPENFLPSEDCFNLLSSLGKFFKQKKIAISYHNKGELIYIDATKNMVEQWESAVKQTKFFLFSYKTEIYKNRTIKIRSTADDRFFCFTYDQGVFIGSYNKSLLYEAIDACESGNSLKKDISFRASAKNIGSGALAGMLVNIGKWFSFDISGGKENYVANGYLDPKYTDTELYDILSVKTGQNEFNSSMIPATTSCLFHLNAENIRSYIQKISRDVFFPDSILTKYLTGDLSVIYFSFEDKQQVKAEEKIACLELTDKCKFLSELKKRERNFDKFLYRHQLPDNLPLANLLGDLFHTENPIYFKLYKNYLLFAQTEKTMEKYINMTENENSLSDNRLFTDDSFILVKGDEIIDNKMFKNIIPSYFTQIISRNKTYDFLIRFSLEDQKIEFNMFQKPFFPESQVVF